MSDQDPLPPWSLVRVGFSRASNPSPNHGSSGFCPRRRRRLKDTVPVGCFPVRGGGRVGCASALRAVAMQLPRFLPIPWRNGRLPREAPAAGPSFIVSVRPAAVPQPPYGRSAPSDRCAPYRSGGALLASLGRPCGAPLFVAPSQSAAPDRRRGAGALKGARPPARRGSPRFARPRASSSGPFWSLRSPGPPSSQSGVPLPHRPEVRRGTAPAKTARWGCAAPHLAFTKKRKPPPILVQALFRPNTNTPQVLSARSLPVAGPRTPPRRRPRRPGRPAQRTARANQGAPAPLVSALTVRAGQRTRPALPWLRSLRGGSGSTSPRAGARPRSLRPSPVFSPDRQPKTHPRSTRCVKLTFHDVKPKTTPKTHPISIRPRLQPFFLSSLPRSSLDLRSFFAHFLLDFPPCSLAL